MRSTSFESSTSFSLLSLSSADFDFPFPFDFALEVTLAFEGVFVRLGLDAEGGTEAVEGGADTLLLDDDDVGVGFEGDAESAGKSDSEGGAVAGLKAKLPAPGFKLLFCTVGLVDTDL